MPTIVYAASSCVYVCEHEIRMKYGQTWGYLCAAFHSILDFGGSVSVDCVGKTKLCVALRILFALKEVRWGKTPMSASRFSVACYTISI